MSQDATRSIRFKARIGRLPDGRVAVEIQPSNVLVTAGTDGVPFASEADAEIAAIEMLGVISREYEAAGCEVGKIGRSGREYPEA